MSTLAWIHHHYRRKHISLKEITRTIITNVTVSTTWYLYKINTFWLFDISNNELIELVNLIGLGLRLPNLTNDVFLADKSRGQGSYWDQSALHTWNSGYTGVSGRQKCQFQGLERLDRKLWSNNRDYNKMFIMNNLNESTFYRFV